MCLVVRGPPLVDESINVECSFGGLRARKVDIDPDVVDWREDSSRVPL